MKEYCVMYPRYDTIHPHRGPWFERTPAQNWIDEAEADGFKSGVFEVWERPVTPWVKSGE